jgi:hypothetical protein
MKLTPKQREELRMKFGGKCAYCGVELAEKGWHADHVKAVTRIGGWGYCPTTGRVKWITTGELLSPENDHYENLFPACAKCNILKANGDPESLRSSLTYFAESIPNIQTYSHVHHLMRFKRLSIDAAPVVFWFEQYAQEVKA